MIQSISSRVPRAESFERQIIGTNGAFKFHSRAMGHRLGRRFSTNRLCFNPEEERAGSVGVSRHLHLNPPSLSTNTGGVN